MRRSFNAIALIAIIFIASCAIPISATAQNIGLEKLENFLKITKTGRAEFTQTVTSPAREGQAVKIKKSSGVFEFSRPNRFKFIYKKPFEQSLVADGQTLWMYDVDLNQVSASKQANVLASTPAALIASAPDLKTLQQSFNLKAEPDKDGQAWVLATPKLQEGSLQNIRVGFKLAASGQPGGELSTLDILDSFGQRSVMSFQKFEINPALGADSFNFKPPAGVDVIKQ